MVRYGEPTFRGIHDSLNEEAIIVLFARTYISVDWAAWSRDHENRARWNGHAGLEQPS
jgi:hypothetical protein